jgi:hypothetical protein
VVRFLRHVYDNGGADDLHKAAAALRTARWRPALRLTPPGRRARPDSDTDPTGSTGPTVDRG